MSTKINNYIEIGPNECATVSGEAAHKLWALGKGLYQRSATGRNNQNRYFVTEVDGTIRAVQSTFSGALGYMFEDRVLVIISDTPLNKITPEEMYR